MMMYIFLVVDSHSFHWIFSINYHQYKEQIPILIKFMFSYFMMMSFFYLFTEMTAFLCKYIFQFSSFNFEVKYDEHVLECYEIFVDTLKLCLAIT